MKIKTYISRSLYILTLFVLISSCKKEDQPSKPVPSAFSASSTNGTALVPAKGATLTISVAGGSNGWWIVVPDAQKSWCVITKVYGSGNIEVPVKFNENTTGLERSVEVTINPTFNLAPAKVVFKQAGS